MTDAGVATERRRRRQIAFNEEHGIEPKSISKRIKDMIDGVYDADGAKESRKVDFLPQ